MEKSFNRFGSFLNFTTFVQKSLIMNKSTSLVSTEQILVNLFDDLRQLILAWTER